MGTGTAYREREWTRSELGRRCAFVDEGCTQAPAYTVLGPLVVPQRLSGQQGSRGQQAVPVLVAFVCDDCMPRVLEWMPQSEIMPFAEVPPRMVPAMLEYVFDGRWPREVRFNAAVANDG